DHRLAQFLATELQQSGARRSRLPDGEADFCSDVYQAVRLKFLGQQAPVSHVDSRGLQNLLVCMYHSQAYFDWVDRRVGQNRKIPNLSDDNPPAGLQPRYHSSQLAVGPYECRGATLPGSQKAGLEETRFDIRG